MLRVLLAIEDYTELIYIQSLMKKTGFDVDGVQSDRAFEEAYLRMNPEVVILSLKSRKLLGLELMSHVRTHPQIIVLAPKSILDRKDSIQEFSQIDKMLESPVKATELLKVMADLGSLDPQQLLEKYKKIRSTLSTNHPTESPPNRFHSPQRLERMTHSLAALEKPKFHAYDRKTIQDVTKEWRASERKLNLTELENERQAFVKALFSKK